MKKIILFAAIIFSMSTLNAQQPQRTPEERAKNETERVKERLTLTEEQAANYEKIALKYANMMSEFRNIPRDSVELRNKKRAEINEKKKAEVKPILTDEQFAKYEKWLEEMSSRMRGGNRDGRGPQNR